MWILAVQLCRLHINLVVGTYYVSYRRYEYENLLLSFCIINRISKYLSIARYNWNVKKSVFYATFKLVTINGVTPLRRWKKTDFYHTEFPVQRFVYCTLEEIGYNLQVTTTCNCLKFTWDNSHYFQILKRLFSCHVISDPTCKIFASLVKKKANWRILYAIIGLTFNVFRLNRVDFYFVIEFGD